MISFLGTVTIGDMVRNKTAFLLELQQQPGFEPAVVILLTDAALPNNNLQVSQEHQSEDLFWVWCKSVCFTSNTS